jgi:hypothetical protein
MSYGEYKNSGRCGGKLLYQLCNIGVPVTYVEDVIIQGDGKLTMRGQWFATYVWNEENTPIFTFAHDSYNSLEQPELFTAYLQDEISGLTSELFHFTNPRVFALLLSESASGVTYVTNKEGKEVDMVNFKPILPTIGGQNSMEAKADALRQAFCTPKRTK